VLIIWTPAAAWSVSLLLQPPLHAPKINDLISNAHRTMHVVALVVVSACTRSDESATVYIIVYL
jgi:hypothetical protein